MTPAVTDTAASSALTACDDYRVNDRYPIRLCDRGEPVRLIQQALRDRGADVDVDGYFGPGTVMAVRRFQGAGGLNVDGLVGPRTWAALVPHAVGFDLDGSGVVDPDEIGSPGSATAASVTATTSLP